MAGGGEHGELRLEGGAVLQNSGTFDEDTYDNEECWEGHAIEGLGSSSSVVNSGTFNVEVGSGRTAEVSAAFENTGTVDVGSGTFTPTGGGGSSGGTWVTGSGAAVAFTAGSYSLTGADAMAASVHVVSGTLVATGASSTVGALVLSGGVLSVAGELGVSGSLASSGSVSVNGGGRLVVQSGASGTIDVPGCSLLSLTGVTLVNDGTMTMGSAGGSAGQIDMSEGAQLQNAGMFDADAYSASCVPGSNNAAIQTNTGTTSLTNTGTLNINPGSANTVTVQPEFENQGTLDVLSGSVRFSGGGVPEVVSYGTWLGEDGPIVLTSGTFLVARGSEFQTRVEGAKVVWVARALTGYLSTLAPYVSGTVSVTGVGEAGVGETFSSATVEIAPAGSSSWKTLCGPLTPGLGGTFECAWETSAGAYPDGAYLLRARLSSANPSEAVTTASTDVEVDNTPPSGTLTFEAAHSYSGLATVTGTASDSGSGVAAWQLELEREGSSEWTSACPPQNLPLSGNEYGCTLETSQFESGAYRLRALISDRAGNTFTTPAQSFPIDNSTASGTIAEPPSFVAKAFEAEGTASGGATSWAVQIAPIGTLAWSSACPVQEKPSHGSTYSCQVNTAALADGQYELRAIVTDAQGDVYASKPVATIVNNTAPTGFLYPPPHSVVGSFEVQGYAADSGSGVKSWQLQLAPAGSETWIEACPPESLPMYGDVYGCNVNVSTLADGAYQVRAVIVNNAGNVYDTPPATVTVEDVAPAVIVVPTITGYAIVGHTLSATIGSWSGAQPITYATQWQRCTASGQSCQNIEGATGNTYVPEALDIGQTDRVAVTATNAAGSTTAYSAVSGVVQANTLGNLLPPVIDGTPAAGSTLTADPGVWRGTQPISYAYQWESCNGTGGDCAVVAGATGASYALGTGDVATTLRVAITATDSEGSAKLTSAPSSPIAASASSSSGIRYLYDRGGRLSIVDAPGQGAAIYQWDPDGNLTSIERVSASTLAILAFSPQQAPVGASVDITGTGFNPEGSQDEVSFDGTAASVTRATPTDLIVEVPDGAANGPITVTVAGRSAHSATSFTPEGGGGGPLARRAVKQNSPAVSSSGPQIAPATPRAHSGVVRAGGVKATMGSADARTALASALASFRPRQPAAWHPDAANRRDDNWVMGASTSPWTRLPALEARAGQTGLTGQVLLDNGVPLANVTLSIEGTSAVTKSDASGRFLLTGLPAGHQVLVIDGSSASRAGARYGRFTAGVELTNGKTTALESTIWMTPLDPAGDHVLPAVTRKETILTNPRIPGLEVRIPAGTTIRSASGAVVRHVNLTAIPVDRAPFPLPLFISGVPTYFTVQPGGAYLNKGAQIIYPNWGHLPPGQRVDFWNYDPSGRGWYIYGKGTVSANGQQVVPDANVRVWEFTGAMISSSQEGPGGPRSGEEANAGDPVDLYTGLFVYQHTDLTVPDSIMPISLTRIYRPRDRNSYSFGIGTQSAYDIHLWSDENYKAAKLVLPNGGEIELLRKSPGTGYAEAEYFAVETAGIWEGATMHWETGRDEWVLRRRDGMKFYFGEFAPLQAIENRNGDRITLVREGGKNGPIVQIRTPHSRGIDLTYDDFDRIVQATDSAGQSVHYEYDDTGRLVQMTDPEGHVTRYAYGELGDMTTVTDARGNALISNDYVDGLVRSQTIAGQGTYKFTYEIPGCIPSEYEYVNNPPPRECEYVARVVTPTGVTRRIAFRGERGAGPMDPPGQLLWEEVNPGHSPTVRIDYAHEHSYAGNLTAVTRDVETFTLGPDEERLDKHVSTVTKRMEYDGVGDVTKVEEGPVGAGPLSTEFAYNSFSEPTKVTDPLGRTTAYAYDESGDLTGITDALGREATFGYDPEGELISATTPEGATTRFAYEDGMQTAITDPLGHETRVAYDAAGLPTEVRDAEGASATLRYGVDDELLSETDANGNTTSYGYDVDGNVTSVTDPRKSTQTARYNAANELEEWTDALGRSTEYHYDAMGRLEGVTNAKGETTSYGYNGLDQLAGVTFGSIDGGAPSSSIAYGYNEEDELATVSDSSSGAYSLGYDRYGRLTSESGPNGSVGYSFDADGERTGMTLDGEAAASYEYDPAGELTAIDTPNGDVAFGYDSDGRTSRVVLPDGDRESYSYDLASRLAGIDYERSDGEQVGSLEYARNAVGEVTTVSGSEARTNLPEPFAEASYDAANELTEARRRKPWL